jgi:two-component system LytT family response regulator
MSSEGQAATRPLRAYLVDDETLALKRLTRLLEATGRVTLVGSQDDPRAALELLQHNPVDVLFLDIEMPELNGFELAARLERQPLIVFTTAFDRYALRAFEVNSIDYLLKPIEPAQLDRALTKLERLRGSGNQAAADGAELRALFYEVQRALHAGGEVHATRLASRLGERVRLLEVSTITHFVAQDKLTHAVVEGRRHCVDHSIAELERRLDPRRFVRIHRATLVNLDWVQELDAWIGGGTLLRLKDAAKTELPVARDRVAALKERLGL